MRQGPISIDAYNENHKAALAHFGNDVLWAFSPVTFLTNGYSSQVQHDNELLRFVDPMKEAISRHVSEEDTFFRQYSLRTRFTEDEVDLMLRLRGKASDFTHARFGKRLTPINSILSAMGLFRVISHVEKCFGRKLKVFEVGPGAGYLGALLIETGHEYAGVDTTQSFYLWQSEFFGHFAQGDFAEQAHARIGGPLEQARVTHVPWWHYVSSPGETPFRADVVICEQAISEMHAWASRFTALSARKILSETDVKLLMFSDYGHPTVSAGEIEGMLGEYEFSQVLSKYVYAYTPGPHQLPPAFYSLDSGIPLYNPSDRKKLLAPTDFLKTKKTELPLDLEFRRFLRIWKHYDKFVID